MSKIDITMYGEQELSLHVLNTEHLYRDLLICEDDQDLRDLCSQFKYTEEQFEELCRDREEEQAAAE